MDHHSWNRIAVTGLLVMMVGLLAWGVNTHLRIVRAKNSFAFVQDLADFSNIHGHLPASIDEFCQWKRGDDGHPVWDAEITARKVRFLWLSPDFSASSNRLFFAVLDPRINKYEPVLNERLTLKVPSNILMRSSGHVSPPANR